MSELKKFSVRLHKDTKEDLCKEFPGVPFNQILRAIVTMTLRVKREKNEISRRELVEENMAQEGGATLAATIDAAIKEESPA